MRTLLALSFFLLSLFSPAEGYSQFVPPAPGTKPKGEQAEKILELPPDQEVSPQEGFLSLEAKLTKPGEVRFLVVGSEKIKFSVFGSTLIVSIPPTPGAQVSVFAVALIDGKLTDFVQSVITVKGPLLTSPQEKPLASAAPLAPLGKLFVTLITEGAPPAFFSSSTLQATGHTFIPLDARDPRIKQLKLDQAYTQLPALILQDQKGRVIPQGKALPLPSSEQELLALLKQISGL